MLATLVSGANPGDDLRPNPCIRLLPDQDSKVLEAHAKFTLILHDAYVSGGHCVGEGLDGVARRDIVRGIDHGKCRHRDTLWTDQLAVDHQFASAKAVLSIEPLDKLMDQFARKRSLVESPAIDSGVNFQRVVIGEAECGVHQP